MIGQMLVEIGDENGRPSDGLMAQAEAALVRDAERRGRSLSNRSEHVRFDAAKNRNIFTITYDFQE